MSTFMDKSIFTKPEYLTSMPLNFFCFFPADDLNLFAVESCDLRSMQDKQITDFTPLGKPSSTYFDLPQMPPLTQTSTVTGA